jgi:hypothetical protein
MKVYIFCVLAPPPPHPQVGMVSEISAGFLPNDCVTVTGEFTSDISFSTTLFLSLSQASQPIYSGKRKKILQESYHVL